MIRFTLTQKDIIRLIQLKGKEGLVGGDEYLTGHLADDATNNCGITNIRIVNGEVEIDVVFSRLNEVKLEILEECNRQNIVKSQKLHAIRIARKVEYDTFGVEFGSGLLDCKTFVEKEIIPKLPHTRFIPIEGLKEV